MTASPPPPSDDRDPLDDAAVAPAGGEPSPGAPAAPPPRRVGRRAWLIGGAATVAAAAAGVALFGRFPPDTTPQGAYLRIAVMLGDGDVRGCFNYLEDAAQHSGYTIRDYRRKASERVAAAYPEPERTRLLEAYRPFADAPDGADVWVELSARHGWSARLRRDLTGVARTEIQGDRATVETARGTRYPFRRRQNGMWGLTMFTAELLTEAERAARDYEVVDRAASDYERAR